MPPSPLGPRVGLFTGTPLRANEKETTTHMATTAQQRNLAAAKWSPNGSSTGAGLPINEIYGSNVFSPAVQRQ